jgi:amylosucrase
MLEVKAVRRHVFSIVGGPCSWRYRVFRLDHEAESAVRRRLGVLDADAFLARLDQLSFDIAGPIEQLYGGVTDTTRLTTELVLDALDAAAGRPALLRLLDRRREIDPAWFQRSRVIGYVCYADRFAGSLRGVGQHLDYLAELGVTYLHLMPLLQPRDGDSDGGYAVADYGAVDPRLGSMADLEALAAELHGRGIALCIDLVLNHTAREHEWARKALAGDPACRDMYLIYPDRTGPDAYEATLPEVFPDTAPGSFTEVPGLGWVWTTFHEYQWDLNYANPAVFRQMLATMLTLANRGVDVLRLDAAPFLWKRAGTDCQNQPEAHLLLQAFRGLTRLAAPGLVLKAEAIVGPEMLVQYLGAHDRYQPECDLAYDNQLMVMLWSTLATRDVRLAGHALSRRRPAPAPTAWVSYLRCHDDIGWAVSDADAAAVGQGAGFQENLVTGDARISGMAASLCGIESAVAAGDQAELTLALRRLESLYAVVFSFGGIPLIYMGDELALPNDPGWADDPEQAPDNRWMHRPRMDWARAARRSDPASVEGRAFAALRGLARARQELLALRSGGTTEILPSGNQSVLAYRRAHPRSAPFLALTNFSDATQSADAGIIARAGLQRPRLAHASTVAGSGAPGTAAAGPEPARTGLDQTGLAEIGLDQSGLDQTGLARIELARIELAPWSFAWLTGA